MGPLRRRLDDAATAVLDTVFPPVCPECGRRGVWVCEGCRSTVPDRVEVGCGRCGAPPDAPCVCAELSPAVTAVRSALPFDGWVRTSIHRLKYEGERARARPLGDLLVAAIPVTPLPDVLVPIPLHPRRLRERGFNQSRLLAEQVERRLGCPRVVEIARVGSTRPQVGLSEAERRANVRGAFAVPDARQLDGLNVALIDDVITTSATMAACAEAVAAAGAASVVCLSVARAV